MKKMPVVGMLLAMAVVCSAAEKSFPLRYAPDILKALGQREFLLGGGNAKPCPRPAAIKGEPKYRSANPLYFVLLRKGFEPGIVCAVDESAGTGKGYNALYADSSGDMDLADEKPVRGYVQKGLDGLSTTKFGPVALPMKGEAATVPYHVNLTLERSEPTGGTGNEPTAYLYFSPAGCFTSQVELDRKYKMVLVDTDSDGAIGGTASVVKDMKGAGAGDGPPQRIRMTETDVMFVDLNGDGRFDLMSDSPERIPCGPLVRIGRQWVRVGVSEDLKSVVVEQAEVKTGTLALCEPVVEATLASEQAIVTIPRGKKQMICPAGEYHLITCELQRSDRKNTWMLDGSGCTASKPMVVEADQTAELKLGGPLVPRIDVSGGAKQDDAVAVAAGQELSLLLAILGINGEYYRDPPCAGKKVVRPGASGVALVSGLPTTIPFVVLDEKGKKVTSGKFESG
jgi:hypothetical protein